MCCPLPSPLCPPLLACPPPPPPPFPYLTPAFCPRSQTPQLRAYLRPLGIVNATEAQWEEELPPYDIGYDKHGKPIKLMDRFLKSYLTNRRNKKQTLQRIALLEDDRDALGVGDGIATLSEDRALTSVANFIKAEESDPKKRADAKARAEWLRGLDTTGIVTVKKEADNATPAAATPPAGAATPVPAVATTGNSPNDPDALQILLGVAQAAAAAAQAAAASVAAGTGQVAGSSSAVPMRKPRRAKPVVSSNLVPATAPTAPPKKQPTQPSTSKAVPSNDKKQREKDRSCDAGSEQRKPNYALIDGDSSDEEGAQKASTGASTTEGGRHALPSPPRTCPPCATTSTQTCILDCATARDRWQGYEQGRGSQPTQEAATQENCTNDRRQDKGPSCKAHQEEGQGRL